IRSRNFDRCAISPSLHPPQAAVGLNAQSRRATNYRSEILSHCSLGALRIALYFFLLMPLPSSATGGGKVSATTPRTYLNNEDYYIKIKG
ncbi:MAG: hypothetical protein IJN81_01875, partial [Clostridia bacterium]|nr:hypothetical protein [Clostridia bacterium]